MALQIPPMNPSVPERLHSYTQTVTTYVGFTPEQLQKMIPSHQAALASARTTTGKQLQQAIINAIDILLKRKEPKKPAIQYNLKINSTIKTADFYIDRVHFDPHWFPHTIPIGEQNLPNSIAPGAHKLTSEISHYHPIDLDFVIPEGQNHVINLRYQLRPRPPDEDRLYVESEPKRASIFIDGRDTGKRTDTHFYILESPDPDKPAQIAPGRYRINLALAGYRPASKMVTVKLGPAKTLHFDLMQEAPEEYKVTITANISNARIFVDDVNTRHFAPETYIIGTGDPTKFITPGQRKIRLERSGYTPQEKTVAIPTNRNSDVSFQLVKEAPPTPAPPAPPPTPPAKEPDWSELDALITRGNQVLDDLGKWLTAAQRTQK